MIDWDLVWTIAAGIAIGRGIVVFFKILFGVPLKIFRDMLKSDDD